MADQREHVDVDLADPDVIRIQYASTATNYRGELVIDRANAAWVADEIDAHLADDHRPDGRHAQGSDVLTIFAGGADRDPMVAVTNNRTAASAWTRKWSLALRAPAAAQLVNLLRSATPPHPLALQLRVWAQRMCSVGSTSKADLSAALDGAVASPPQGVVRLSLDDREVGLGGVNVDVQEGVLTRAEIEAVFGEGLQLRRLDPSNMLHQQHEVLLPDVPYSCTVFVRYGVEGADDVARHVKLRVDAHRPQTATS